MEKYLKNDICHNGQSQVQQSDCLMLNGIKPSSEKEINRMSDQEYHETESGQKSDVTTISVLKSRVDLVNGKPNNFDLVDGDHLTKSLIKNKNVIDYQETHFTSKTALMLSVNSLVSSQMKIDSKLETKNLESVGASEFDSVVNSAKLLESHCDAESCSSILTSALACQSEMFELDNSIFSYSSSAMFSSSSSATELKSSEDSRLLENRLNEEQEDNKEIDKQLDDNIVDLKSVSAESDKSDAEAKKMQKTKTPDSFRPFSRLLHDLGQELVRQLVYKDLIQIQATKDTKNKLDEKDKSQLMKLTEAHTKLCARNEVYHIPSRSCRCGFMSTSDNVMVLHHEFGHSFDQFPHVCCYCDSFKSKWPSQFVAHMETVHTIKARIQKKLAPNVCFFCPYEHKNWMKIELHMSKCGNKFSLSSNLQPQPADCDIPVLYKPGQLPRNYPINQTSVANISGRFPLPTSSQVTSPLGVTAGQASVMEIDGQLYSLVNHNGKVLLTSLRSQIGAQSPTGAVILSSAGAGKVPFPPPRPPQPGLDPIKPVVPVHRETCEICGSVMSSREALWNHFRDVHRVELSRTSMREQEPWMKCTFCNTRFWTYQGLARHSSTHHNRNIAPLPQASSLSRSTRCYLCGNSQTSNPLSHFSTFHNITLLDMYQSRQCCMCNKRLKQSRAFEEHMIVQHRDIFANSEVLHTVIQALSTAYYLKTEDGILPRPPLMLQQLQQNISGVDTNSGAKIVSNAKLVCGISLASDVKTVSGIGMPPVFRTVSTANVISGLKMFPGTSLLPEVKMVPSTGVSSFVKMSNSHIASGVKVAYGAPEAKMTLVTSANANTNDKIYSQNIRSCGGVAKSAALTKTVRLSDSKKLKARHDLLDRSKADVQIPSSFSKTPKKTREEDEKDLNKLYKELSDIGRPILRSMRQRLTQNDEKCNALKRSVDSISQNSETEAEADCSRNKTDKQNEGPAKKICRLDSA